MSEQVPVVPERNLAELLAPRELHESRLKELVERMKGNAWKGGEVNLVFADQGTLRRWVKEEKLPTGKGRAVARAEVKYRMADVAGEPGEDTSLPKLAEAGYTAVEDPDYSGYPETFTVEYFLYEKP